MFTARHTRGVIKIKIMMIKVFLITISFVHFIEWLFEKWNVWAFIDRFGSKSKSKFIFELTNCRMCMKFHLSIVVVILIGLFYGFFFEMVAVPFMVNGITHLIRK